jgi:hypothetical protein
MMTMIEPIDPEACHLLVKGLSHGVSTDGTQTIFVFEDDAGKRVTLRMNVGIVKGVMSMFHDVAEALERRGGDPGTVLLKTLTRPPLVGNSPQFRGYVVLSLEYGTQNETGHLIRDDVAMQLARNLEYDVSTRKSAPERAMMTAGMRRIILPPGH